MAQPCYGQNFGGIHVDFPHEDPYKAQKALMANSLSAYRNQTNALLESPTGTGKTLALLASALAYQQYASTNSTPPTPKRDPYLHHNDEIEGFEESWLPEIPKVTENEESVSALARRRQNVTSKTSNDSRTIPVWYTSRTHTQIKQLVSELKKLPYKPQMAILASRKRLCLNKAALGRGNIDEECLTLVAEKSCPYGIRKSFPEEFKPYGAHGKYDIEDLLKYCQTKMLCPYYMTRDMLKEATLVMCPYNYVLNPKVKGQMQLSLLGVVLIIDEAHNVEAIIRESTSFYHSCAYLTDSLMHFNIFISRDPVSEYSKQLSYLREIVYKYLNWMKSKTDTMRLKDIRELVESDTNAVLEAWGITNRSWPAIRVALDFIFEDFNNPSGLKDRTAKMPVAAIDVFEQMYVSVALCFKQFKKYLQGFKIVVALGDTEMDDQVMCINVDTGAYFSTIADEVNSIVMSSGTLAPLDCLGSELGTKFSVSISAPHVINQNQLAAFTLNQGIDNVKMLSTYKSLNQDKERIIHSLGLTIENLLGVIPGGVLFFVPSHPFLRDLVACWKRTGLFDKIEKIKPIFYEEQTNIGTKANDLYLEYKKAIEDGRGGFMIGVCRGRMSEGIDFSDDQARAVFIFGIPYPPFNQIEIKLKREFNRIRYNQVHNEKMMSGDEWYEIQAYRSLFQAAGRCIRHQNDYGSIILLDERFENLIEKFPRWMKPSFNVNSSVEYIKNYLTSFFQQMFIEHPIGTKVRIGCPSIICCKGCMEKMVYASQLGNNLLEQSKLVGLFSLAELPSDSYIFTIEKENIDSFENIGDVTWSEKDGIGYQLLVSKCGLIVGAKIAVASFDIIPKFDDLILFVDRVLIMQGKVESELEDIIKKRSIMKLDKSNKKGQQMLVFS